MSLIIAGDLVPSRNDVKLFENGSINELLGKELCDKWSHAKCRIFNLEAPIIDNASPIIKFGPNLKISEKCIYGIKKLNPSLIMLANNHIMDYGVDGLNKTLSILSNNQINYIGVGNSSKDIKKYSILSIDNKKVAIYNCAEKEFSIALDNTPGAFGYNDDEICNDLQNLKIKNDYVIVIYHGGKEHYRYPSPQLRNRCRKMVENGANLVVCQHSHCIGCMEEENESYIIYGQGNFLFNLEDNDYWKTSLILDVYFEDKMKIDYIPIIRNEYGVSIPNKETSKKILNDFMTRSNEIKEKGFIEKEYNKLAEEAFNNYLCALHGSGLLSRILNKITRGKHLHLCYKKSNYAQILNYIECESHNELLISGLKCKLNNHNKD